jgi:hypothetical protein
MKIIKTLLITSLILILAIVYLSVFGIKTNKFNNQISNNISKINKKINLDLGEVSYLFNPYKFTIKIKTKNPQASIEGINLKIKDIQTNISLKALIKDQFLIDNLQILTKEIKLENVMSLARKFKNSPQLFVLDTMIKDGLVSLNINLNFDKDGNIKKNYEIKGYVKKAKLNILNQLKIQNLNFNFGINKNIYSLKQIDLNFKNTILKSSLIEIKKEKDLFFVNGQFLNDKKDFNIEDLKAIFSDVFNDVDIKKIEFSSENSFSFNINKNLKLNNFKIESVINLNQLISNQKNLKLKTYLPSFNEKIKFDGHKIVINYNKNKLDIKGSGNFSFEDKTDNISYQITKDKDSFSFNLKTKLKNNSLLLNILDYEKKEGLNSLVLIKGNYSNKKKLRLNFISLEESDNKILIKGLDLSKRFKIIDIKNLSINLKNSKKVSNKLQLKKDNSNFFVEGEIFDASKIINNIMESDEDSSSIFENFNSKINIRINQTYIDEVNYINNLNGHINYKDNKINDLELASVFSNGKKINLSIKTNNNLETITRLFSSYPKPLIRRYNFIKGFEEGYLDLNSTKRDGVSKSLLIIDNFKVKEVPIFAKLLSLASLQGIADLLTGEGIRFTDFEMKYSNEKDLTTIEEMYAIGPAVSILMDGYIQSKKLVSLRGTLVPATTINRSISSIPFLGKILIGEKTGEGVFGVSFKIKGPPKDLKTTVNPIKTLTPRFITRTLEKIKKN